MNGYSPEAIRGWCQLGIVLIVVLFVVARATKLKLPIVLNIGLLTLAATMFYTVVGQSVPQKMVYPPEETVIAKDLTTEEMVQVGEKIMSGKGLCLTCHTIGKSGALRFPDLAGIGGRAGKTIPGLSDVEYLAHSLYEPDSYIVPGFNPGMPTMNKKPIALTDQEILCVIAKLQSLGGTPTVTLETKVSYTGGDAAAGGTAAVLEDSAKTGEFAGGSGQEATSATLIKTEPTIASIPSVPATGADLFERFACAQCHSLDAANAGGLEGPGLHDVGARLERGAILLNTVMADTSTPAKQKKHDALVEAGMFSKATVGEVQTLVDFLAKQGTQP